MPKIITDQDMRAQVVTTLAGRDDDYDVVQLVDALITAYGVCDVDDIPSDAYWATVARFDVSA